jgi:hypothetical protein
MRYYKIRRLKRHFEGPVWDQVKRIVRDLCDQDEAVQVRAENLLAQFCYADQAVIIRFLRGRDI